LRYKQRTLDEIKKILDDEYKNNCRGVVFTGGEPTVHQNLVEAVEYAKSI
jgi:organic radical activating enzyme